jgi:23S rRNA pseudouridine1911/1915/1917 synthase
VKKADCNDGACLVNCGFCVFEEIRGIQGKIPLPLEKNKMTEQVIREWILSGDLVGLRLDQALSQLLPEYSRSLIQEWIKSDFVRLNGKIQKPKYKVSEGDALTVSAPLKAAVEDVPEAIPLTIVFEDDDLLVIDKPIGLVVHPGAGNAQGTLMNALLHYCPSLKNLPRAGIVHRLDKDTSGLMVVAKTREAKDSLIEQLKTHEVSRVYIAFVHGYMVGGFTVDAPIGRHHQVRTKMAVVNEGFGKPAVTHVRVLGRSKAFSMLEVELETGRTHQIRVHLAYKGYPLLGDLLYGGRKQFSAGKTIEHQALHAKSLSFHHPKTGEWVQFESELPPELLALSALI